MQHAVKSSPMDVVNEYFWEKNCSPCAGFTCQGNHFEFIPTMSMESQHSTGVPTCHDFEICNRFGEIAAGSRKSLTSFKPKWRFFLEKRPLAGKFSQLFPKSPTEHTKTRLSVQISWNLADRKSVKSRVAYLTKKNKISALSLSLSLSLLRRSRPKSTMASGRQCT